jgi:hypothetical protein
MGTEHGHESTHDTGPVDAGTPETGDPAGADPGDDGNSFDDVLHHLGMAMALVATATHALEAAENNRQCSAVGSEIATLQQAVEELQAVHEELDLAILGVEP